MSDTASRPGRFVVSAKRRDGFIQQTRIIAASAIVLAQEWQAEGHTDVTVIDPAGKEITPESYRDNARCKR